MKTLVEWCGGGPLGCAHCGEPAVAMYMESGPWQQADIGRDDPDEIVMDGPLKELFEKVVGPVPIERGRGVPDICGGWKQSEGRGKFLCLHHAQQALASFRGPTLSDVDPLHMTWLAREGKL